MTLHFGSAALFLSPLALAALAFFVVRPLPRRICLGLLVAFGLLTLPLNGGVGNPFSLLPFFAFSAALGAALAELAHLVLAWRRGRMTEVI